MIGSLFYTAAVGSVAMLFGVVLKSNLDRRNHAAIKVRLLGALQEEVSNLAEQQEKTSQRVQRRNTELLNEAARLQLALHAAQTERDNLRTALQNKEAELQELKSQMKGNKKSLMEKQFKVNLNQNAVTAH